MREPAWGSARTPQPGGRQPWGAPRDPLHPSRGGPGVGLRQLTLPGGGRPGYFLANDPWVRDGAESSLDVENGRPVRRQRPTEPRAPGNASTRRTTASGGVVLVAALLTAGCGTTREYNATEQLVMSEAVDKSISQLDFRPLSGRKVYLDTSYLRHVKGESFVNSEYVTSALRQQIVAAGCFIQDSANESDVIVEARIGTLGADNHRVTFGIPENNAFGAAVSLIPGAPAIASIPEIALARREAREAAVKVSAFAYDRNTRAPVWQSGVDSATATARDTWVLGVGPFQGGSIREETRLAGSSLALGDRSDTGSPHKFFDRPPVDHSAEVRFQNGWPVFEHGGLSEDMLGLPEPVAAPLNIAEAPQAAVAEPAGEDQTEPQVAELPVAEIPPENSSNLPEYLQR